MHRQSPNSLPLHTPPLPPRPPGQPRSKGTAAEVCVCVPIQTQQPSRAIGAISLPQFCRPTSACWRQLSCMPSCMLPSTTATLLAGTSSSQASSGALSLLSSRLPLPCVLITSVLITSGFITSVLITSVLTSVFLSLVFLLPVSLSPAFLSPVFC